MNQIRLIDPVFPSIDEMRSDIDEMYKTKIFSNGGKFTTQFEDDVSSTLGFKNSIAVANGSIALNVFLKAHGISRQRILVPNFTFAATVQAIYENDCTPIYVDIDPKTLTMCMDDLHRKYAFSTVIMAVDSFGNPCHYDEIDEIGKNKTIIYDSAGSIGASYKGADVGSSGNHAFSLHATKLLPVGEGGLMSTDNDKIATSIRSYINFGLDNNQIRYRDGVNGKIDELRSIFGIHGLKNLKKHVKERNDLAEVYYDKLDGVCEFQQLTHHTNVNSHQLFPLLFKTNEQRNKVKEKLLENNVLCKVYYDTFDKQCRMKHTEKVSSTILCVPLHNNISKEEIGHICKLIKEVE